MKPQTLKKLQEAVRIINYNAGSKDISIDFAELIVGYFNAAIYMEEEAPKRGKFNLYDYTGNKKEIRGVIKCVHYQDGFCYATDSYILVKTRIGYDDKYEGKNIDKDGNVVDLRCPNYCSVIPSDIIEHDSYSVNLDLINEYMKSAKCWSKSKAVKLSENNAFINFHGMIFSLFLFHKLCIAMQAMGMTFINRSDKNRGIIWAKKDDEAVVLMEHGIKEDSINPDDYFYCKID